MKIQPRILLSSFVVAIAATVSHAQVSLFVSQSTGDNGYGYGFSSWTTFTSRLNTAVSNASGSITTAPNVSNAGLFASSTSLLLDQRWVSGSLSATELSNLSAYIASGRRVLLIGENAQFWSTWDAQILGLVGDTVGADNNGSATPSGVNALTTGVGPIALPSAGTGNGLTGTALFDVNFSRLYGSSSNVLTVLDVNIFSDGFIGNSADSQFADNVINWLITPTTAPAVAVPEPSTYGLFGIGALVVMIAFRRLRAKSSL